MKEHLANLPLFRKVLLFSFFITFLVVISTAGLTFVFQTKQMQEQLTNRAVGLASLWSTTISIKDVKESLKYKDTVHPSAIRLKEHISLVNEKTSYYLDGTILLPRIQDGNKLEFLVVSKNYEEMGIQSFSEYSAGNEYLDAFKQSIKSKKVSYSKLYRDQYGLWVSAFAPIMDKQGNIIAVFAVDGNATMIERYEYKIAAYIFIAFFLITVLVYFILKTGLVKVLEPVHEIVNGLNEVSSGNFNVKIQVEGQSDLGRLGERFNIMTNHLSLLFERLSSTSEELGTVNRDITLRHPIEEAIGEMENIIQKSKLQRELQRAEKMNAIGQLAASVAHEIRNPMTVVKGFLQIFHSKDELSDEERMYVKLMIDEMNRAETIINDYLSLARPDIEEMVEVNGTELAHKVMDLMSSYAMMSKDINMKIAAEEPVLVKGNKSELMQVLINILKNGIEAMKDGGKLSLKVYQDDKYGIFEISDTGVGMTEDELKRLGTAFYSLKEKGTGMGMMVCYQIIDRMKGKILVESEKGVGTSFKIYVPRETALIGE